MRHAVAAALVFALFACVGTAQVTGRYVRIENPTAPNMAWQEIEVIGRAAEDADGEPANLVLGKPELFSGTGYHALDRPLAKHEAPRLVDGRKDPAERGPDFSNGNRCNPWIEIDLGAPMAIAEVRLYGSRYPDRIYLDKEHRLVSILDDERQVVWAAIFRYRDTPTYPDGIFAFRPQSMTGGLIGIRVPENSWGWIPLAEFLDVKPENPPADAAARMARFAERDSPANIKALTDELFGLLEPVPELARARELHTRGQHGEALDAWKTYWFARMAQRNRHAGYDAGRLVYASEATDLLDGLRVTIASHSIGASRFTPGRINWVDLPEDDPVALRSALQDTAWLALVNTFGRSLLEAYGQSGEPACLRQWAAIMDDWCLNYFRDADASPDNVKDLFVMIPANHWCVLMEQLGDIAAARPEFIDELSAATLARVQLTCLDQYGPAYWRVARRTVFNHNASALGAWHRILPYIDEFRPGRRLAREWRQHLARWMTRGTLRDGSMAEVGDEGHFMIPMFLGYAFHDLRENRPDWYTPGVENRSMEYLDNLYKYVFRHNSPGGYAHRFGRRERRYDRWTDLADPYQRDQGDASTEVFLDRSKAIQTIPEVRRIIDALCDVSNGRAVIDPELRWEEKARRRQRQDAYDKAVAILGDETPGPPKVNSDWMPYTGSWYFRGGWSENEPFLAMLAPGARGGSNFDVLGWDYGLVYTYDYNYPLTRMGSLWIDGKHVNPQYPQRVFMPGSKTQFLTCAQQNPAPFRWHSSDRFDYGEAVYEGAYQNLPREYPMNSWPVVDFDQPALTDVTTSRRVIFLRRQRLFIVIDAVHYRDPTAQQQNHNYRKQLTLMTSAADAAPVIAEDVGTVRTANPDAPNGTIRQFADFPIRYALGRGGKPDPSYDRRVNPGLQVVPRDYTANWQTTGDFAVVSLLSSADHGEPDPVATVRPLNAGPEVAGFAATLADGTAIVCQSTVTGPRRLDGDLFAADAQTVVAVREADGLIGGLALGCMRLTVGGQPVATDHPDFEFANGRAVQKILRPIEPVTFEPAVNVFTDTLEVRMQSATPGVEIRYTTDGSPPGRESHLYAAPVIIRESTEFAARAYRIDESPIDDFEINGTRFTVPSYGWFYNRSPKPPIEAAVSLEPGLSVGLIEAPWTTLFSRAHWMEARAAGVVEREMELDGLRRPTPYAVLYRGHIAIPRTGVYTFHAPPEYVAMDTAPSYDLRLYVDGEEWDLAEWWHGLGTWSVPLARGLHRFELDFADARSDAYRKSGLWRWYPTPHLVHQGNPSPILVSGPDLPRQRIPAAWFRHAPDQAAKGNERGTE